MSHLEIGPIVGLLELYDPGSRPVIAPEKPPPLVVEKEPVIPTISSTPGVPVVITVMVPEALMPLPVTVKVPTVVSARVWKAKDPTRIMPIPNVVLIGCINVY